MALVDTTMWIDRLRSPHDCPIAATVLAAGVPLLHDDREFERIAAVCTALKLLRGWRRRLPRADAG